MQVQTPVLALAAYFLLLPPAVLVLQCYVNYFPVPFLLKESFLYEALSYRNPAGPRQYFSDPHPFPPSVPSHFDPGIQLPGPLPADSCKWGYRPEEACQKDPLCFSSLLPLPGIPEVQNNFFPSAQLKALL